MITIRAKSFLIFAGAIALLGLLVFASQSSRWTSREDTALGEHIMKRQQAERQLAQAKIEYEQTKEELTKKVSELSSSLQKMQAEQKVLKAKYVQARQELIRLVSKPLLHNSIPQTTPDEIKVEGPDNESVADCDSIRQAAIDYVIEADSSISNLEQQVSTLQQIGVVKDSTIAATESIYQDMEIRVQQMVQDGKELEEMVRKNQKRERRKKFFRRVGAAGLLVLSGVATSLLLDSP
jgi:chromosome segregation ATPase